jgi:hypothetical protein
MAHEAQLTDQMRWCIDACLHCHRICMETVNHCLTLGGRHADARHIRTLLDCGQICSASADFLLRGSNFHARACGVCAEVCAACVESCLEIGPHDQTMQRCAEVCRECGDSCRKMAGMTA